MRACPSIYQLEKAIRLYGDDDTPIDMAQWCGIDWVYSQLSRLAKISSYVGMSHFVWWKRTYILPHLCQGAVPYLKDFQEGAWTKTEEAAFSAVVDFFSKVSKKLPELFERSIVTFLSQKKPSFDAACDDAFSLSIAACKNRDFAWKSGETYREYTKRIAAIVIRYDVAKRPEISSKPEAEVAFERVSGESIARWKAVVQQIPEMLQEIRALERELESSIPQARAMQDETGDLADRLLEIKKTVDGMLDALELQFPSMELLSSQMSQKCFSKLIVQESQLLQKIRKNSSAIRNILAEDCERIALKKEEFAQLCRRLSRLLDGIALLPSENPFRVHQARVLKEAREMLKECRQLLLKGIDIMMTFDELSKKISSLAAIAKRLYDEGKSIDLLRSKTDYLQKRIDDLPILSSSARAIQKQNLCEQLLSYKKSFEFSCQREEEFDRIERAVCRFEG